MPHPPSLHSLLFIICSYKHITALRMAGALNTNSSGVLTKQATVSQGSTHFRDIARAWFHLASCQSYNIWDSLPLCQAESRGSEVKPFAKDIQPAEGKTRIRIQEVFQPCPLFLSQSLRLRPGSSWDSPQKKLLFSLFSSLISLSLSPNTLLSWSSSLLS